MNVMAQEKATAVLRWLQTSTRSHERSIKIYAMAVAILLTYEHKKMPIV